MQVGIAGYSGLAADVAKRWLASGVEVVVWDKDPVQAAQFPVEGEGPKAVLATSIPDFVAKLASLRRVFLLGGSALEVDDTVRALAAQLDVSDIVVDATGGHFDHAEHRINWLSQPRARYVGMGVVGPDAENFAHSFLVLGGHRVGSEAVAACLESLVPKANMIYLGTGGTAQLVQSLLGAFVSLEASIMAEILKLGLANEPKSVEELSSLLSGWNQQSGESPLLGALATAAKTSKWATVGSAEIEAAYKSEFCRAAQTVVRLNSAVPAYLVGYASTSVQASDKDRETNTSRYPRPTRTPAPAGAPSLWEDLRHGFTAARLLCALQLVQVTRNVSDQLAYGISAVDVVRVLRQSALTRSALFEPILTALSDPNGANLFAYPRVQFVMAPLIAPLRKVVVLAVTQGSPMPVGAACLCYFDAMTAPASPTPSGATLLSMLRDAEVPEIHVTRKVPKA